VDGIRSQITFGNFQCQRSKVEAWRQVKQDVNERSTPHSVQGCRSFLGGLPLSVALARFLFTTLRLSREHRLGGLDTIPVGKHS
jgi:hypothetical protein